MDISKDELIAVLSQFNPWWRGEAIPDLPNWQRAAFHELYQWVSQPPAPRAVLLSGARQIGKTTLLLQSIAKLLKSGVPAANILYTTVDHPIIKLAGIEAVIKAWREREPKAPGPEYLFLDEAQFIRDWGTWVKHQVDFVKDRRIIFTGSAMPLLNKDQESGVGRWHTIRLSTLSFYEYLQIKKTQLPKLPEVKSLQDLFLWPQTQFDNISQSEAALSYVGHFHEYLVRGGFPQTALVESVNQAQRLMREDIIDKVLKRDMTALFGVRRVLELEQAFLYLCMHDGGLLDITQFSSNLEVTKPTAKHFIELLETTNLIYRLQPYGYGKEILRAKYKIYLADAAIAPAVLLKGKEIINDPEALGIATETAVFKHLFTRYYGQSIRFAYWQNAKKQEVDIVAEMNGQVIPFEIKYRSQHANVRDVKGLIDLCKQKSLSYAYVITKSLDDFGLLEISNLETKIMRIPAPLLCYWLGEGELMQMVM